MVEFKKQICNEFIIMENQGKRMCYFDKNDLLEQNREENLILFIVGRSRVEYCKQNFQYFDVIEWGEDSKENYQKIRKAQNQLNNKLTIITGVAKLTVRAEILTELIGDYTKAILIITPESKKNIVSTAYMMEEMMIESAYINLQMNNHTVFMGVDEVAFLYK